MNVGRKPMSVLSDFYLAEPQRAKDYDIDQKWPEIANGCLIGMLDSPPQYTRLLKSDDPVAFHPKHIVAFFRS